MTTLLIFMTVDYVSGLLVAGVFKKSNKTSTGKLNPAPGGRDYAGKGCRLYLYL